jgi:hypothetical protein
VKWKLRIFGGGHDENEGTVDLSEQKAAARAALAQSQRALEDAQRRQPEVTRVSRSLAEMRRRNNFAQMIEESFKGVS